MGCGVDKLTAGFLKLLEMVNGTQVFLQRILEIHIISPCPLWPRPALQEAMASPETTCRHVSEQQSGFETFCPLFCTVLTCHERPVGVFLAPVPP